MENAAPLLQTSDELGASRLRDICMRFVVEHFDTVSKSEVRRAVEKGRSWLSALGHRGVEWSGVGEFTSSFDLPMLLLQLDVRGPLHDVSRSPRLGANK